MAEGATKDSSHSLGRAAEVLAKAHLERQGWRLEGANLRRGEGELDLVAWEGETLVFVEVKGRARGRTQARLGAPEEAVDRAKRRRLVSAAEAFLSGRGGPSPVCRFDVVAVEFGGGEPILRHIRDAFRVGD